MTADEWAASPLGDRYDGWDLDYAPENTDDAYRSPDGPTPGGDCPAGGPHSPADDGPYCDNCHARLAPEDDPR